MTKNTLRASTCTVTVVGIDESVPDETTLLFAFQGDGDLGDWKAMTQALGLAYRRFPAYLLRGLVGRGWTVSWRGRFYDNVQWDKLAAA